MAGYTTFINPQTGASQVFGTINPTLIKQLEGQGFTKSWFTSTYPTQSDLSRMGALSTPAGQQNLAEVQAQQQAYIASLPPSVTQPSLAQAQNISIAQSEKKLPGFVTSLAQQAQALKERSQTKGVDVQTYNNIPDEEKYKYHIEPTKVSKREAENLGSGVLGRTAVVKPTKLEQASSGVMIAAEILVPGVYEVRHWKDMSGGQKAFALAIDVICVIPFAGAAMRGARAVEVTGRGARLLGAAKGVGGEAINMVRWPVDAVVHPIQTIKGAVGGVKASGKGALSILEDVAHPSKIPEAVLTTTEGTVRLPINAATTPKEAMVARNIVVDLVSKGERPVVEINGARIELSQSAFMKEVKGGLVHATPMGEAWQEGGKVALKPGMGASEQGLFLSHEPLPRFVESSAFGKAGTKPVFIVISQDTIKTGKIYRGTAEMERKLPVGAEVYKPVQRLFTRIGPQNTRVEIWLDKPLSRASIAKLKAMSLVEGVKTLYTPAIKITKLDRGLAEEEVKALSSVIKGSGDAEVAGRFERVARIVERGRTAPPALLRTALKSTSRAKPERITTRERVRTTRESVRVPERPLTREPRQAPPREVVRTPTREVAREAIREPPREPVREQPREPERVPPREPTRIPPRTPDRRPPREEPPRGSRVPGEGKPPRYRRLPPSSGLQIERVEGVPRKPGLVVYDMGVVRIKAKPPYRKGTEDIEFEHLKTPTKGKGSEQASLRVYDGDAPQKLILRHGWKRTSILRGEELTNTIIKPRGRGTVIGFDGRVRKSRKKGILK